VEAWLQEVGAASSLQGSWWFDLDEFRDRAPVLLMQVHSMTCGCKLVYSLVCFCSNPSREELRTESGLSNDDLFPVRIRSGIAKTSANATSCFETLRS